MISRFWISVFPPRASLAIPLKKIKWGDVSLLNSCVLPDVPLEQLHFRGRDSVFNHLSIGMNCQNTKVHNSDYAEHGQAGISARDEANLL